MIRKKIIYGFLLITGVLTLGYFFISSFHKGINNDNVNIITSFHDNNIQFGGDFTLTKHDQTDFTFSSVNGKPSLIYFGFTHCPDFCPASLHIMEAIAKDIDINRIFISVDPDRDTPQSLADYVALYDKGLIGLTGTPQTIDAVAKNWKIYYSFNKTNEDDKNYTVDHTTYLYLTDKNGKPMAMIRPEATPQEIIHFIKENNI